MDYLCFESFLKTCHNSITPITSWKTSHQVLCNPLNIESEELPNPLKIALDFTKTEIQFSSNSETELLRKSITGIFLFFCDEKCKYKPILSELLNRQSIFKTFPFSGTQCFHGVWSSPIAKRRICQFIHTKVL